ncbi:MAG: GtrA family protein [Blastococcus sp.]|nr:GtrA family protein [Blastococcus sp.]
MTHRGVARAAAPHEHGAIHGAIHATRGGPPAAETAQGPVPPGPDGGALTREASGFATVGAFAVAVDIGGYNALVHLGGHGPMAGQPLLAKIIAVTAATTVAYFGNRFWTYRDRPRGGLLREYALFVVLSAIGLSIALACLAVSRYVLGLTSAVADNIAANVVGLALGSLFRFLSYRRYVFPQAPPG